MEFTEAETPKKIKKITNKRKKAKESENDSSSGTISKGIISGIPLGAPSMYLERNESPSLWISLPRADQSQLLTFVLGDKLIEGLPGRFNVFLKDWLSSIQQKMIETLKGDGLRKTMKSVNVKCHESIKRSDERICTFLQKTLRTILETQEFSIFEKELAWICFIRRFAKNWNLKEEIDETVLTSVFDALSPKAKGEVSSFFTGSQRQKTQKGKVYYCHILRFVVKFTFNTLRHVFKFDSQSCSFFYDGNLEQEEISHHKSKLEKVAEKQVIGHRTFPFPTPVTSTSGTSSMDLISAIPLGAPSMHLERNESPSLWITLPQAEKSQLLKFVLEDDLIKDLSKGGKRFLTDWLLSVQQQMIETLKDDGLRKIIESVKVEAHESLRRCDERPCIFLQKVLETVLQTEQFVIFKGDDNVWLKYIRNFVQKGPLKRRMNESNLKKISIQLSRKAKKTLSSFFPGPHETRSCEEAEVYFYHILRFVLKFAFNTLRHVFKFERQNCSFFYDGELEEEGICNQKSMSEKVAEEPIKRSQTVPFQTPITSGNVSMGPIFAINAPSTYLERNEYPSLWITLPKADQSQLLRFVLGESLTRRLPKGFKVLLTDWLLSVQHRMIETLERDGLRNTIESLIKCQESLKRSDERLCFFVEKVMRDVLETKHFAIFEGERVWIDFIRSFVKDMSLTEKFGKAELKTVSKQLDQCAQNKVISFFSELDRKRRGQAPIYFYHILRFALKFALNTLRHVFKFDSENSTFFYDGELETEEFSYQNSEMEKVAEEHDVKPQVVPFPVPVSYDSSSGTISKNPTTTVSFGAPSMQVAEERDVKPQLPLAVPLEAPVQKPQGHLPPKEVVPTVPPSNDPSSSNIGDKMSQYMQFFDSSLVPQKWLNAFKMVVQHNEYLKSQEARLKARYKELKAEVQELKEEKRRRMI
ncbi:hypothetical protein B9Z55_000844 [Caenorhabditis nigoni]|nr:hypothetical protein B9Z55_000844 [Caenorhabditis nigoni]